MSDQGIKFRPVAALLLGLALAASPALAEKGGNGGNGGKGGGGSQSSASQGGGGKSSKSEKSAKTEKSKPAGEDTDDGGDSSGNSFGNINGFLNASDRALARASSSSIMGRVLSAYGEQLSAYLATTDGTGPTPDLLQQALEDIANKPVTAEMVAAVNARLMEYDDTLAQALTSSGKTIEDVNQAVLTGEEPAPPVEETTEETAGDTTEEATVSQ